ncbi:MAG: hypothetical protein RL638_651 [Bacteroidota bacterium]|jgi:hypothetical protein
MHKFNLSKPKWIDLQLLLVLICHIHVLFSQNSSPLSQGKWIKIAVTQSQFYHLNNAWLSKNKINIAGPENLRIYGTPPGMLEPNDIPSTSTLKPVPTFQQGNSSSAWEILFWGDSPHKLTQKGTWTQETHLYSDTTFYYIQVDAQKSQPIEEINPPTGSGKALPFAYGLKHYEPETYNLLQSGQTWLGDAFYGSGIKYLQYALPDYAEGFPAHLTAKFYASSISASRFSIPSLNLGVDLNSISGNRYDKKATNEILRTWLNPSQLTKNWNLPIQFQSTSGTGYIDYVSLMYPRTIDAKNGNPLYLLPNTSDSTIRISIPNLTAQQQIWINNGGMQWQKISQNNTFQLNFKPNSRLAIADFTQASEPVFCGLIQGQSVMDIDANKEMIIIASPALQKEAEKLASYKSLQRNIPTTHLSTSEIYQDFSGGKQDVTAIRNFIAYQANKKESKLKYVIILGDASIDYKGQNVVSTAIEKSCFVPTYQSSESFQPLLSYASDDYFGITGSNSGNWDQGPSPQNADIRIAIGRIPAKNSQEANMFINKLIDYEQKGYNRVPQFAWVADDGDANIHMQDAEDFSDLLLKELVPGQQHKVYLDQFPIQQNNGVSTSPLASKAVRALFEEKADFIHYTGHGSESGLADEKLLTTNDILGLKNSANLPIFLTATCQFGRFDDPNILSGGEVSLMSDQGGAIALISTTRPVFQSSNYLFGQAFYRALVANRTKQEYRLGDLFRDGKNQSQSGVINRNIQLLGDPSLSLPWSSNNLKIELDSTLQELVIRENANNTVNVQLHRTSDTNKTLGNKGISFQYRTMSPIIWKTSGSSKDNIHRINLKSLPNISNEDKYLLHVWSSKGATSIPIKNWRNKQIPDQVAPSIRIQLENEELNASSNHPTVLFTFADSSGLAWQNNVGKIASIVLDDSLNIELAPLIQFPTGTPKLGTVRLNLRNLSLGDHQINVFCWDVHNNFAQKTLEFQVTSEKENLSDGIIYPNPLSRNFHFVFELTKPWNRMPYKIELTNLMGQTILTRTGLSSYQESNRGVIEFEWDENEWQKINQIVIVNISLNDESITEKKIFRIKTSTLK